MMGAARWSSQKPSGRTATDTSRCWIVRLSSRLSRRGCKRRSTRAAMARLRGRGQRLGAMAGHDADVGMLLVEGVQPAERAPILAPAVHDEAGHAARHALLAIAARGPAGVGDEEPFTVAGPHDEPAVPAGVAGQID